MTTEITFNPAMGTNPNWIRQSGLKAEEWMEKLNAASAGLGVGRVVGVANIDRAKWKSAGCNEGRGWINSECKPGDVEACD